MLDVAEQAEVSITTVYRYYPTKRHLFSALLLHYTRSAAPRSLTGCPAADVTELMVGICRSMLANPRLARAMITSVNARRAETTAAIGDFNLRELILSVAGICEPTPQDTQLALLVEQCAFGVLSWAVMGETTPAQAEADMRRACELLLAPWAAISGA